MNPFVYSIREWSVPPTLFYVIKIMSSFNVGLGSWKKGGRVADSSMLTRNQRVTVESASVKSGVQFLTSGIVSGVYIVPAAKTTQTVLQNTTPADSSAFGGETLARRNFSS
jgi:hypothetical protein